MFKRKFAALAAAATLSVALVPTASAQSTELPLSAELSSEEPWSTWGDAATSIIGGIFWTPIVLSTMTSSLFAEQCNLFDTRACH